MACIYTASSSATTWTFHFFGFSFLGVSTTGVIVISDVVEETDMDTFSFKGLKGHCVYYYSTADCRSMSIMSILS